jgi:NitT/TauT family transport system substrate-binding protein
MPFATRRTVLKSAAAGAAILAMPAVLRAQSPVRIGMSGWTGFSPLSLAADAGLFEKAGIPVEIIFIPQKDRLAALAASALDAVATTIDAQILWATTVPLTQVLVLDKSKGGDGVAVREGINSFADLAGKTIACDAVGTAPYFMLSAMLKENGLSIRDMTLSTLSPRDAATAFVAGQFDAAATYEPYLSTIRNEPGAGKILATTLDYPVIQDTLSFPSDQIEEKREAIQKVVDGWFMALDMIAASPDEANTIMGKRVDQTAEQFAKSASFIDWQDKAENQAYFADGLREFMAMAVDLQAENGVIRRKPDVEAMIDDSFVG